MNLKVIIGLEIHIRLNTASKLFCRCPNQYGGKPNSYICPVCAGLPGALPVVNKKAVEYAVLIAGALHCKINKVLKFDRKNYFYPDLPKGYQITQRELPLGKDGYLKIISEDDKKKVPIAEMHLEEDAGKLIHEAKTGKTLVDLNRCGTPLVEIVTTPSIDSPEEASYFLKELRRVVRYLGVSDGNMEQGSLRCDANISLTADCNVSSGRSEIKNLNSFKNVEKALSYEIEKQKKLLAAGKEIADKTLLWDEKSNRTVVMRSKEGAKDYCYLPEPDLLPVHLTEEYIKNILNNMPELPEHKRIKFKNKFHLPDELTEVLTDSVKLTDMFEKLVNNNIDPRLAATFLAVNLKDILKKENISLEEANIDVLRLSSLLQLLENNKINRGVAEKVCAVMLSDFRQPAEIVNERNWWAINDTTLIVRAVNTVLEKNKEQVRQYLEGKEKLFNYFTGLAMKETQGKADIKMIKEILEKLLEEFKANYKN